MGLTISIQEDYILVAPSTGINYWEIIESIGKLMGMDGCQVKNVIWEFCDGPVKIAYDDLYIIKNVINKYSSKYAKQNKTAIVVATGFQLEMAHCFAKISKDLPCVIGIFSDIRNAKNWIIGYRI